jgi:predicted transcriptional regulator
VPDTIMLSLRLPSGLAKRLATVAAATDRTRTYVAARAIEEYVESEEETLAKIREGLAQADAGETVSHAEALVFVERLKARARRGRKK